MTNDFFDFSQSLSMPRNDVLEAFEYLKSSGEIYTPAKTAVEFTQHKYPFRVVGMAPQGLQKPSEVSFGPFCLKREHVEQTREHIQDDAAFQVYLGLIRLAYEKTGGFVEEGYHFETKNEDSINNFLSMMDFWDIDKPVICKNYVWIVPNDMCKHHVEKILGKKFSKNDYSWWNVRLDLGSEIMLSTSTDYPNEFSFFPSGLIKLWAKYLPSQTLNVLIYLYLNMTIGGKLKAFCNLEDVHRKIQEGIEFSGNLKDDFPASFFDRELLIKELCDYNSVIYPIDTTSTLDFFQQIGFIKVYQSRGSVEYILSDEIDDPQNILKTPKGWEDRMSKFLINGSVLFSYLTIDEIINNS